MSCISYPISAIWKLQNNKRYFHPYTAEIRVAFPHRHQASPVYVLDPMLGINEQKSHNCKDVVVLEPKHSIVEYGRSHGPKIKFIEGGAENIPLPDEYFDKVVASASFHHFSDQNSALEEMKRVLKLDGKVIILVNWFTLAFSEFINSAKQRLGLTPVAVTLAYPILDSILIIPSSIVLVKLLKNYQDSVPWLLSSLSLLVSAIADDGYLIDFVNGNSQHLIFRDLFCVADFIIMAGALFWFNRYHISTSRRSRKTIELEP